MPLQCSTGRSLRRRDARGLGLATATASAAFFPHLEQRIRSAISFSVTEMSHDATRLSRSVCSLPVRTTWRGAAAT
jgi:hypothetical protein